MNATQQNDQALFDSTIRALHAELANAGAHMVIDNAVRQTYAREVMAMSRKLTEQVKRGQITWAQAASQAQKTRNDVMYAMRSRSTPVGRARAVKKKPAGPTLNEMIAKKTLDTYGQNADFTRLSPTEKNVVYEAVVKSGGTARPKVTADIRRLSRAGRGLIFLSLALSVYSVATAEDKVDATKRELTVTGMGIAGGIAGGALAGLACGPGAPVCVVVGAFVGGALAAFSADYLW